MQTSEEIIIKVSPEIAQAYRSATDKQKQWFQAFTSLFFEQGLGNEIDFLGKIMDEISDRAVARGMTPEILESILNE
jgi:hypothetical protein